MSIKICKINYFSFSFKLNEKKKVSWGIQETFGLRGDLIFIRVLEIFQKKGEFEKKELEKNRERGVVTLKESMSYYFFLS